MAYKRLTKWNKQINDWDFADGVTDSVDQYYEKIGMRLCDLEDKIESGRLVESIKEVRVPPYDKFSIWDKYGISKECYICRNNITNDPYFIAHCFNMHNRFENSEQGLQDAVVWLEEQRANVLLLLGYKELQE